MVKLKEKRKELKMSQQTLSEKSGVDRANISDIERGVANPTYTTIKRLANALGCEVKDLV